MLIFHRFVPRQKMTQKCDPVVREECGMKMRTDCSNLCKEDCQDKDKRVCMTVPHQECQERPVENCEDIPKVQCRKVSSILPLEIFEFLKRFLNFRCQKKDVRRLRLNRRLLDVELKQESNVGLSLLKNAKMWWPPSVK